MKSYKVKRILSLSDMHIVINQTPKIVKRAIEQTALLKHTISDRKGSF